MAQGSSRRGRVAAAGRPRASHPLTQLPWLAFARGDGEKSRDAGPEAEWGRPVGPAVLLSGSPWELRRCYLGLAGAEVPYANGSLLGEEKILPMALCNLL